MNLSNLQEFFTSLDLDQRNDEKYEKYQFMQSHSTKELLI